MSDTGERNRKDDRCMTKPQNPGCRICVRIHRSDLLRLRAEADVRRLTVSHLVRIGLARLLAEQGERVNGG